MLADYQLNILDRVPEHYFQNARKFKQICDELKLEEGIIEGAHGEAIH